jgi:D-alanyl-D-alanine-carboxypeptidase/D-alanyl-D-alanine-endopeptidase
MLILRRALSLFGDAGWNNFKKLLRARIHLVFVTCLIAASSAAAAGIKEADRLVQPLLDGDAIVGCVIGIVDGESREVRGYGSMHRNKGDRPNADTVYEIGSVTKVFTGTLLADMTLRGEVKLDAPLQDFLPAGVTLHLSKAQPIRLIDLATQTSGLPRLPDNIAPKDPGNPYSDYSPKQMIEFLGRHQLRRPPGEYEYSNFGMGVLGFVLAKKAAMPYEQLVVERICDPLKMNDTRINLSDEQRKRLAPPFNAELSRVENWDFDALAGCGAVRSTVNDLLKLVEASLSIDNRPVVAAIHQSWKPSHDKPDGTRIGLGWAIASDGVTRWHNGQTSGYSAAIFVFPPKRLGVVVLSNTATGRITELAEKILQSGQGMSPKPIVVPKSIQLAPAILKNYEGTYDIPSLFPITISVENGYLVADAADQGKFQLFAKSETEFFCKRVNATINFEKGPDGKVNKLILHQNDRDTPGKRLPKVSAAKQTR